VINFAVVTKFTSKNVLVQTHDYPNWV